MIVCDIPQHVYPSLVEGESRGILSVIFITICYYEFSADTMKYFRYQLENI